MKKIIIIISVLSVAIMLVLTLGGCTQNIAAKIAEKAIENSAAKEGESVDINLDEGQVNITDKEGNEVSIGGTSVPDGWPSSVPVSDKIKISLSGSSKTDGKANWNISGTYNGTGEELYNYYKDKLSSWNSDSDSVFEGDNSEKTYSLQLSNDTYVFTLFVTESTEEVVVIANVGEK
jgi:hypothetical protein